MTIRELYREFVVAKRLSDERHDRDVTLAYNIAALTRGTKGLPKLDTLLSKRTRRERQSAVEQVAMWQVIAARFGGEFRPRQTTGGTGG